ncbi:MAG: hypothetical protein LBU32_08230 [Clostridiales bacterium]|jgi:hypothetical protein|nr:hypothetical protein [Clostridiales bacterium]
MRKASFLMFMPQADYSWQNYFCLPIMILQKKSIRAVKALRQPARAETGAFAQYESLADSSRHLKRRTTSRQLGLNLYRVFHRMIEVTKLLFSVNRLLRMA